MVRKEFDKCLNLSASARRGKEKESDTYVKYYTYLSIDKIFLLGNLGNGIEVTILKIYNLQPGKSERKSTSS